MPPTIGALPRPTADRKSTRLNSSHTDIYTLSLHDALPIWILNPKQLEGLRILLTPFPQQQFNATDDRRSASPHRRSEEHTSELQSHRYLHSFPTRRSSDLDLESEAAGRAAHPSHPLSAAAVQCHRRSALCLAPP